MTRHLMKFLIALTIFLLLLLGGAFWFLQSDSIQSSLEKTLDRYVSEKSSGRVSLKGVKIKFPYDIHIESISFLKEDLSSPIVNAEQIKLRITPWMLLFSKVSLSELEISKIHYFSTDSSLTHKNLKTENTLTLGESISWPILPITLSVDNLNIHEFVTNEANFNLEGSLYLKRLGGSFGANLKSHLSDLGEVKLNCIGRGYSKTISVDLELNPQELKIPNMTISHVTLHAETSFEDLTQLPTKDPKTVLELKVDSKATLLESDANLKSTLLLASDGSWKLKHCKLQSLWGDLNLQGLANPSSLASSKNLIELLYSYKQNPLDYDLKFSYLPSAKISKEGLKPVHGSLKGEIKDLLSSEIDLKGSYRSIPISSKLKLAWNYLERLNVHYIEVDSSESSLSGYLNFEFNPSELTGELHGSLQNFPFATLLQIPYHGNVDFDINVASISDLDFSLSMNSVTTPYGKFFEGKVVGSLRDYYSKKPLIAAKLKAENLLFDGYSFEEVSGEIASNDLSYPFNLKTIGSESLPLNISLSGNLDRSLEFITIEGLEGSFFELPLLSTQNFTIQNSKTSLRTSPIQLLFGEGNLLLESSYTSTEGCLVKSSFYHVPIKPLQAFTNLDFIEGSFSGKIDLNLSETESEGNLKLSMDNLLFHPEMRLKDTPLSIELQGDLSSKALSIQGLFKGVGSDPSKLIFKLPLRRSKQHSWMLLIDETKPLKGKIEAKGKASSISKILLTEQDILEGDWEAHFDFGGTFRSPKLIGKGKFEKGTYENLYTGLSLHNIELNLQANNHQIIIQNGKALSDKGGEILIKGGINLKHSEGYPLDVSLNLKKAAILQMQDLSAIAYGNLKIQGPILKPTLLGEIELKHLELLIPDHVADPLPTLDVTYVYPQVINTSIVTENEPYPLQLDLKVKVGQKSFLRGRGMNSEWSGNLSVTGELNNPKITGFFDLIRGDFSFSSTSFNLTEGKLIFVDPQTSNAYLSLKGEAKVSTWSVYANLQGDLNRPKISFSSSPSLPETEVISLILFGSTSQNISPFQALQLAQAAVQLSKGYSSLNVIGQLRQNIGLDQLNVTSMDENPTDLELQVGKYLSDDIYITLVKSLSANTNLINLSVEFFNKISLGIEHLEHYETQIVKNRLQASWKHNY